MGPIVACGSVTTHGKAAKPDATSTTNGGGMFASSLFDLWHAACGGRAFVSCMEFLERACIANRAAFAAIAPGRR